MSATIPKGSSCFTWTDAGGTSRQLDLDWPLELEPGGRPAGHDKNRFASRSLDLSNREVAVVDPGVFTLTARIRYQPGADAQTLIEMLRDAADGIDLTWEPTCGGTPSYTVQVENADEAAAEVQPDPQLFAEDRRQTVELKLYRPDGGNFSEVV